MGTAMPGWTSQATTGVAFVPLSSGAESLRGAGGMVLNMPWMETEGKDTAWCQHRQPHSLWDRDTQACERCLWLDTCVALSGDPWLWVPPRPGPVELEGGWLLPHHPCLVLPWALQGQVLWCFTHDRFLSPLGCHWGSWPHWYILPTLGSVCPGPAWPWALALSPGSSAIAEACGGAEGYFTGYFTCWHQLFLPSAPNHVPHPQVSHPASSLPSPLASPITGHCCSSATFLLCPLPRRCCPDTCSSVSSPVQEPPALGSYSWVTGGTRRGVAAPQDGFGSW